MQQDWFFPEPFITLAFRENPVEKGCTRKVGWRATNSGFPSWMKCTPSLVSFAPTLCRRANANNQLKERHGASDDQSKGMFTLMICSTGIEHSWKE
jgi:hypothetical protein